MNGNNRWVKVLTHVVEVVMIAGPIVIEILKRFGGEPDQQPS